jgi:hypothetical protein
VAKIAKPCFEVATVLDSSTGSAEFYGITSTFVLIRSLKMRLAEFEKQADWGTGSKKRPRTTPETESNKLDLDGIFKHNGRFPTDSQRPRGWKLRESISDVHLDNYFRTVHHILPIIHPEAFRTAYHQFWSTSPLDTETITSRQWQCLMYSVLAMGALYSDTGGNDADWAANYFSEAQELIVTLFGATCIEVVQAAMLMVPTSE